MARRKKTEAITENNNITYLNEDGTVKDEIVMQRITDFLESEGFKYIINDDKVCEIIVQGDNMIIQIYYYVYNHHLILRVPHFVRNVNVMRPKIIYLINKVMEETLDIRYEIGNEGKSISATCQFLLEDALPTNRQLKFLTMLIMNVVDEYYPKFMHAIYGPDGNKSIFKELDEDMQEGIDECENMTMKEIINDPLKIN